MQNVVKPTADPVEKINRIGMEVQPRFQSGWANIFVPDKLLDGEDLTHAASAMCQLVNALGESGMRVRAADVFFHNREYLLSLIVGEDFPDLSG